MGSPAFRRLSIPPFLNTCICFTLLVVASVSLAVAQSTLHFVLEPPLLISAGEAFAAHVEARDGGGDPDDDFDPNVVVALAGGASGLSGTTARKVDGEGIARFNDLSVGAGGIYRLVVTGGSATPDTSRSFTVVGNVADELEFQIQPGNTPAGAPMATVQVRAVLAPTVTDPLFNGDITIAIGNNPGGGTLSGTTTVQAVLGVATFNDLMIDAAGSGYTLVASASGLPDLTSNSFNITAGPASGATTTITANPTSIPAGGGSTSTITVEVFDAEGNPLTSGGDDVELSTTAGTLSSETDNGNGTYTATLTAPSTPGSATISGTVNGQAITDTEVVTFTGPGPASGANSQITASPTSIPADGGSTSTIMVELRDASGTPLTSGGDNVQLSTTAGTLGSVSDNGNGTYTAILTAASTGGSATISGTVNGAAITDTAVVTFTGPGPPSGATSQITASPTSIPANGASTSTITVELRDASGTPLIAGGDAVQLSTTAGALGSVSDNGNGTYTATLTAPSTAGTATISGTVNGNAINDTAVVTFTAVASALEFVQQPTNEQAGAPISPAITVRAVDGAGTTVTSFSGNVTIAIGTNPAGGTLSGTTTVAAINGVATFGNLSINRTGTGYTLAASSASLSGDVSAAFAITPGPASPATTQITASPTSIPANGTNTSTITVQLRDALGNNLTSGSALVALNTTAGNLGAVVNNGNGTYTAILTAPSSTTTTTATITGTVGGQAIADNATVTFTGVSPTASRLVFAQQPTNEQAGATISPAVTVRVVDNTGATITSFTGNVTLAIGSNPGGGTLSGTTTVAAVAGVATFSNLRIEQAGAGYTLAASASGLTGATSAAFSITPGPASAANAQITASPTSVPADGSSTSTITVELRDAFGNRLTSGGDVVTLSTTAGSLGPVSDIGNGTYTAELTAPSGPTTATVSGRVNATAISDTAQVQFTFAPPTTFRLEFGQPPTNTQAGRPITPAVTVRAVDNTGALQTSFTGQVTIAIGANPASGTLSGTTTTVAVGGIATFSNLSIDKSGSGYRLSAGASGFAGATSGPFAITPAAASGATTTITAQPTALPADGASTSTITVDVRDALGNRRTGGGDQVTLSTTAGTLGPVTDQADGTYVAILTASSTAATATITGTVAGSPISDNATVVFGSVGSTPVALAFGQQPGSTPAGVAISPAVTVRAVDGGGSTASSFTGTVTIALGANPGGGTLSGTTTATAVAGVATFANLRISQPGAGYTLTASAAGLTGATSAPFTVTTAPVEADLAVTASVDDASPAVGDTVRYTIRVTNTSAERVTGVEVSYELDERLTFVSSVPGAGSYNPQTEVWSVGVLEPGEGATLEIEARVVR
ncbi:MAG TPA: invasin domain 3-containing protein [Gemmatimonadota bacterium]|nr:invasin domain 3-containing protein [Gemmatimonadota bacterium]